MNDFDAWWEQSKDGVCFDFCYRFKAQIADPQVESELKHIACQAWVAGLASADCEDAVPNLPKEFAFLQLRKQQLRNELIEINRLEANLDKTRELMARAMNCVGSMTQEEFRNSEGGQYMRLFLDGKLAPQ